MRLIFSSSSSRTEPWNQHACSKLQERWSCQGNGSRFWRHRGRTPPQESGLSPSGSALLWPLSDFINYLSVSRTLRTVLPPLPTLANTRRKVLFIKVLSFPSHPLVKSIQKEKKKKREREQERESQKALLNSSLANLSVTLLWNWGKRKCIGERGYGAYALSGQKRNTVNPITRKVKALLSQPVLTWNLN